jgi:hypothetical protein
MKRQFSCPLCGSIVKRNTLTEKSLDELEVQKDFRIRKRVIEMYDHPPICHPNPNRIVSINLGMILRV